MAYTNVLQQSQSGSMLSLQWLTNKIQSQSVSQCHFILSFNIDKRRDSFELPPRENEWLGCLCFFFTPHILFFFLFPSFLLPKRFSSSKKSTKRDLFLFHFFFSSNSSRPFLIHKQQQHFPFLTLFVQLFCLLHDKVRFTILALITSIAYPTIIHTSFLKERYGYYDDLIDPYTKSPSELPLC